MIIYNVTTLVSWRVHEAWKSWMLGSCIPSMLATGIFSHHQLVRLLEVDETEGATYALQLYVKENSSINDYKQLHHPSIEQQEKALWGDEILSFASLMRVIN